MTRTRALLLILFTSLIIYSNSLGGEFAYDDEYFIVKNIRIRNLRNIPYFFAHSSSGAFAELSRDVYRPVTTTSYALDFFLWKLDTFGYHLANVLFHSLNAILLFLFLYALFENTALALFASLFFACHPVQTEVVSWISGRSSVLFLFFYLASLVFYVRRYYALSLALFGLSLFSKEMAVSLPLVIIAYDIHFFNKEAFRKKILRYAPYFALAAFYVLVRSAVLQRVSQCGWWGESPYYTFLTMAKVLVEYIKILILPAKLCAFYIISISRSIAENAPAAGILLLTLTAIAAPFIFRRATRASFAIWWFFITLLPVSNIVPLKALMAERFLYLPSIGFAILAAIIIKRAAGKRLAAILAAALVIAYSARTMARNEDWKDVVSLSKSILAVSPLNPWGYTSLGTAYLAQDRYADAEKALKKAIALSQDYASPRNALGFCYLEMEKNEDAIRLLKDALKLSPRDLETMNSLGVAYAKTNRFDEAIGQFQASIRIDPAFVSAYLNLGAVYERKRELDKAVEEYRKVATKTNSAQDVALSYVRIGDVYSRGNEKEKARSYYRKAIELCGRGFEELRKVVEKRLAELK